MTRNIKLSTMATIALFTIVGCGGGSSSTSNDNNSSSNLANYVKTANTNNNSSSNSANYVKTGIGYYVDAAVKGVSYVCGSKTGITDKDGKFTFEKGKECKFALGGIPLRTTKANELVDGKEVLEDNPKVAKFLQSIDSDGDLSNGIQITDKVLTALTKALETEQSTGKIPKDDATLTRVVANVAHDVPTVTANIRTDEEVQAHLNKTRTSITKKLLAGKTFYLPYTNNNVNIIEEITVNSNATSATGKQIKGGTVSTTYSLAINGSTFTTTDTNNITKNNEIVKVTSKYVEIKTTKETNKFYFTQADAQASLASQGVVKNTSSISGVWKIGSTNSAFDYFIFLPNGNFMLAEYDSSVSEPENGLEAGTYTYNGSTLTFNLTYDKNAPGINSGIGDIGKPINVSTSISNNGKTLTITTTDNQKISFEKVNLSASPMYGVWTGGSSATIGSDFSYLAILPNNEFLYGEYDSKVKNKIMENGLEAGTYSYNAGKATFNIIYDENGYDNNGRLVVTDTGIGNKGINAPIDLLLSSDNNTLSIPNAITWNRGL